MIKNVATGGGRAEERSGGKIDSRRTAGAAIGVTTATTASDRSSLRPGARTSAGRVGSSGEAAQHRGFTLWGASLGAGEWRIIFAPQHFAYIPPGAPHEYNAHADRRLTSIASGTSSAASMLGRRRSKCTDA